MTEAGKNETLKTESHLLVNQNLKIIYLQDEIKQLQEKITDLDEMLKFNKESLKMALNMTTSLQPSKKSLSNSNQDKSTKEEESTLEKSLKSIISHMDQENNRLLKIIDKLTKERNSAQSKALINEQIADEAQKHEVDVIIECEAKISDMLRSLNEKEKKIQEFEKIKPIMDKEGLIVQYREILSPSEQIIKLHGELEWTKSTLLKICREVTKLQTEKKELLSINFSLVNELNKLRVTMISPLNSLKQTDTPQDLNKSALVLLDLHKKFLENSSDESDQLSPMHEPFPEKVPKNIKKERSDTTPDAKSKNLITKGIPLGIKIPKLDLTQAKKIQEINAKKSSQQALPKVDNKIFERFHHMENEMEKTKKLLQKEMGDNKILIEENEILRKQHREASAINEILALSQRKYEEKWKKLYHALQFYKDFYHKYLELILSNVSNKTSEFQDIDKYREQHSNFEVLLRDPEKVIREKSKKDDEAGKLVNISILEYNDENIKEDHKLDQICQMTEREDFRNYLLNLAKDVNLLFNITKKNSQNNKAICPAVKFKRSMSNPIDYRTEIKKLWLENVNNKPINLINANEILIKNEKALIKNSNRNIGMPLKSPAFGINYSENKENDELGLESPEQMIYHTNYEEEEIV